jgi:prepilin-type N-terminal cleavage/methylation domain-containing protein
MTASPAPRRGFTMVELLVVISIIAILSSLLMAGAFAVRTRAKVALTSTRLGAVHTGLAHAASERDLLAVLLSPPNNLAVGLPATALKDTPFGDKPTAPSWAVPQDVNLRDFEPGRSLDLLFQASEFAAQPDRRDAAATATARAAALADYENDRSPKQPWNDAWGQPLVVAYACYDSTAGLSGLAADQAAARADIAYHYQRSIYVSVGSGGAKAAGSGTVAGRLPAIWTQVNDACNKKGSASDRFVVAGGGAVNAFVNAPWEGVEMAKQKSTGTICTLTAPQEYR